MENMEKLKAKNILVTGGAGFIGSHLVDELIAGRHNVFVLDNLSSGKKANINPKAKFYKVDVRDKNILQILKKEKIGGVFHLAAQPIVDEARANPLETIETNIMGTANVLEACRQKGNLNFIVVVSSDKAYGRAKKLPYKEAQKICRGFKKTAQVIDNIYYCPSCLISLSKKYEKKVGGSLVLRTCERCGKFFYTCKDLLDLKKKSESSLIKTPSQTR